MEKIKNEQPHVGCTLAARGSMMSLYVKITSPCHILAYSGFSGSLFHVFSLLNEVFSGEQEKESIIRVNPLMGVDMIRIHHECEDGIEKSVPPDHRLSSLGKPCDAKP